MVYKEVFRVKYHDVSDSFSSGSVNICSCRYLYSDICIKFIDRAGNNFGNVMKTLPFSPHI